MTPIAARTASGSRGDVVAGDAQLAGVGADQGREDLDDRWSCRRRWGRAARRSCPRRRRGRCRRARPVAERLAQPGDGDRAIATSRGHRAPDHDLADGGARAHLDGLGRRPRGASAASSALCTRPSGGADVQPRGGALADADLERRRCLVSSTTEPRTTSPSADVAVGGLGDDAGRARRSTAMLPLAALSRRSPPATPTQVSPLEFLITALPSSSRRRTSPEPAVTSAWPVAWSTLMSPAPLLQVQRARPRRAGCDRGRS